MASDRIGRRIALVRQRWQHGCAFRTPSFALSLKSSRQRPPSSIVWIAVRTVSAFDVHMGKPIVQTTGSAGRRQVCRTRPSHRHGSIPPGIALPRTRRVPAVSHRQRRICRAVPPLRSRRRLDRHSRPRDPMHEPECQPFAQAQELRLTGKGQSSQIDNAANYTKPVSRLRRWPGPLPDECGCGQERIPMGSLHSSLHQPRDT